MDVIMQTEHDNYTLLTHYGVICRRTHSTFSMWLAMSAKKSKSLKLPQMLLLDLATKNIFCLAAQHKTFMT